MRAGGLRGLEALRALILLGTGVTGYPLAIPAGCTFADADDRYGGHTSAEWHSAYDEYTGLPRDGGVGYTC